jgi:hypothetical protein
MRAARRRRTHLSINNILSKREIACAHDTFLRKNDLYFHCLPPHNLGLSFFHPFRPQSSLTFAFFALSNSMMASSPVFDAIASGSSPGPRELLNEY